MWLTIEMRGVDPVNLFMSDGEEECHIASGDGVVFASLEAEDVRAVLAIGP
jgi:hypothetical protein